MIIVLDVGSTEEQVGKVLAGLEALGMEGRAVLGAEKPLIHVTSGQTRRARKLLGMDGVQAIVPTSGPRVRGQGRRFYPYHFLYWSAVFMLMIGVLVFLAGYLPPGIGAAIDPHQPPAAELTIPWYLRAPAWALARFPEHLAWVGWLVLLGCAAIVFFLPVLDRSEGSGLRARGVAVAAAVLAGVVFLVFAFGGMA